jgi:hypothetical protein
VTALALYVGVTLVVLGFLLRWLESDTVGRV